MSILMGCQCREAPGLSSIASTLFEKQVVQPTLKQLTDSWTLNYYCYYYCYIIIFICKTEALKFHLEMAYLNQFETDLSKMYDFLQLEDVATFRHQAIVNECVGEHDSEES